MTVCVAALCENGEAAVMAADRSISWGPFFSSNGPDRKIFPLCPRVAFAVADTPLGANFVSQFPADELASLTPHQVSTRLSTALFALKQERMAQELLRKYHYDSYDSFLSDFRTNQRNPADKLVQIAWEETCRYQFKTRVIIAGPGLLCKSDNACVLQPQDSPGFAAIGAGDLMSVGNLTSRSPMIKAMKLAEATYWIYEAKKMGERAHNVGKETDMVIITDKVVTVPQDAMDRLETTYQKLKPRDLSKEQIKALARELGV